MKFFMYLHNHLSISDFLPPPDEYETQKSVILPCNTYNLKITRNVHTRKVNTGGVFDLCFVDRA